MPSPTRRGPASSPKKRTNAPRPSTHAPAPPNGAAAGLTYAAAGVDLETYDQFIDTLPALIRRTHTPRVIPNEGGFAGLFRLDWNQKLFKRNYKDPVLVACTDGVGTKVKLAAQAGIFDTVGIDLVAMSVNDLIVQGAEPLFFLDYIAVGKVDKARLSAMVAGVAEGCRVAGCALLGGETAEMPDVYRANDFDMAGFAVGVVELRRAINPERCAPGDVVLGLASSGCHSNGYSLVRKVVEHAGLDLGATYPDLDPDRTLAHVLLEPTRIYAEPIVRLQRGYSVKNVISGMAHITGGGLADNLARALSPKVDAVLDAGSWTVPPVFAFLQRHGSIADDEMARVFNMGVGYCLIAKPAFAGAIQRKLERMGETVFPLGKIARGKGRVRFK
ncbi:MAG: phosphoribosylformylglycinamidine cyclo-ligase [Phycisphaerales bacterium]